MSKGYRPAPGRPPPPPSTAVSLEPVETPKPIAVSVDIPLKLDEGFENNKAKPIKPEEVKEGIEVPLRLEEEPEEMDKVVEEMKSGQGLKGRVCTYGSVHPSPPSQHSPRPGTPPMEPITFPLGEHMVVEAEGRLSCRICSRAVSLGEADKLAETHCTTTNRQQTQNTENRHPCDVCRAGEGVEDTPILDPLTGRIDRKMLCRNCFNDYLRILRFSGPRFGRVKARTPTEGIWFSYGENNSILFTQIGNLWPCPSCQEFYENLYKTVTHYSQRHPEIANKPNERITVDIDGKPIKVLKTAQGYLICSCGFVAENDKHLAKHYINSHKETV